MEHCPVCGADNRHAKRPAIAICPICKGIVGSFALAASLIGVGAVAVVRYVIG